MSIGISAVQHNLTAMFANRQFKITNGVVHKSAEKLTSGYRINRSADDAAGLAISEKMRKQIRGLTQASKNLQDGVSLSQVADGALAEVHDMLQRINELAIKAANGTMSSGEKSDRDAINKEVQSLKKEMSRVFKTTKFNETEIFRTVDTIYNPEVEGYPNNMGIFHAGNGSIGGLEFNNVRYTISELQGLGFKIDNNGIATEAFEVEFDLFNGEHVKMSMAAGQNLNGASRNYTWEAQDNGMYINGKLAAEWSEVKLDGQAGKIKGGQKMPSGTYSFTHQGMTITFDVDSELNIADLKERINGTDEIKPATWDVKVGSPKSTKSADILEAVQNIRVSQANKSYMNHKFELVADENGLAVKDVDAGTQTGYVAWNTFKDSSLSSIKDENGNDIPTNGGYPIVDWGSSDYANNESGITFDADAKYHFTSPNSDMKIEFDFKLADYASLDEVKAALNGASLGNYGVVTSGRTEATGANQSGLILGAYQINSSFVLQRDYGRDFDDPNDVLTATLYVKRTDQPGGASESDTPTGADGTYQTGDSDGIHSVVRNNDLVEGTPTVSDSVSATYYYKEEYDDGSSTPAYHYYKVEVLDVVEIYNESWTASDTWRQAVDYTFDGTFNGYDMENVTKRQVEEYIRTLYQSGTRTVTYNKYSVTAIDESNIPSGETVDVKNDGYSIGLNGAEYNKADTGITGITTTSIEAATLSSLVYSTVSDVEFKKAGSDTAFKFHLVSNVPFATTLANTSSSVEIGTVKFTGTGYASRNFEPSEKSKTISETQFSNVKVNEVVLEIPPRRLIIQSGADSDDQIEMEWGPLNLAALGMYSTKTLTQEQALEAIDQTAKALQIISSTREKFGAYQNRFEHAIKMTDNTVENTTYAESMIRDTDMAKEMVRYSNANIIAKTGQAMLAQANQSKQGILSLLSR